jgi:IS5 family transposase
VRLATTGDLCSNTGGVRFLLATYGTAGNMDRLYECRKSARSVRLRRDPEMHRTKKANEWHFGMTAHIGVNADSGQVHSVVDASANGR